MCRASIVILNALCLRNNYSTFLYNLTTCFCVFFVSKLAAECTANDPATYCHQITRATIRTTRTVCTLFVSRRAASSLLHFIGLPLSVAVTISRYCTSMTLSLSCSQQLSYRRKKTARCFLSLNISLSHS